MRNVFTNFLFNPAYVAVVAAVVAATLTALFTLLASAIVGFVRDTHRHNRDNYLALLHFKRVLTEVANRLPVIRRRLQNTIKVLETEQFTFLQVEQVTIETEKIDAIYDANLKNQLGAVAFKLRLIDSNMASQSRILDDASADFRAKISPEQFVSRRVYNNFRATKQQLSGELKQICEIVEEAQELVIVVLAEMDSLIPRYRPFTMRLRAGYRRCWHLIRYRKWSVAKPKKEALYQRRLRELRKFMKEDLEKEQK